MQRINCLFIIGLSFYKGWTGAAAYNIGGRTIHNALRIDIFDACDMDQMAKCFKAVGIRCSSVTHLPRSAGANCEENAIAWRV